MSENKFTEIKIANWKRQNQFEFFNSFENPTYGMNVRLDVTALVEYVKRSGHSFFKDFLFILTTSLNKIEEMRLRERDGKIVLYDAIDTSYMITSDEDKLEICRQKYESDYNKFILITEKVMNETKKYGANINYFNDNERSDYFYFSCVKELDFVSAVPPIPTHDRASMSIPRVGWGKFVKKDGKYEMTLNITVSHALVDGVPLSKCFNTVQQNLDAAEKILR